MTTRCYLIWKTSINFSWIISLKTLLREIDKVKVDLITHSYPLVKPLLSIDGVRMASPNDISAMKLNAISGNGVLD